MYKFCQGIDKNEYILYIQSMKQKTNVIIITGASSGIGLETAKYLTEKGHIVYGIARRQMQDAGFNFIQADICNHEQVESAFSQVFEKEGRIDVVINNAGMGISGAVEHTEKQRVESIFGVNVVAGMDICKTAIPYLRKCGSGKIINISSVASVASIPFQSYYSATKSAIETFSLALANEVKKFGIKVCCIRPGDTKTGFTSARVKNEIEKDENYGEAISKSVKKMENDEQKGKPPISVSKVINKVINRKNPPLVCTVGFGYKCICVLIKLLPTRFANWVIGKLY